jgi:hypothetical protein
MPLRPASLAGIVGKTGSDTLATTYGAPGSQDLRIGVRVARLAGLRHTRLPLEPGYITRGLSRWSRRSSWRRPLTKSVLALPPWRAGRGVHLPGGLPAGSPDQGLVVERAGDALGLGRGLPRGRTPVFDNVQRGFVWERGLPLLRVHACLDRGHDVVQCTLRQLAPEAGRVRDPASSRRRLPLASEIAALQGRQALATRSSTPRHCAQDQPVVTTSCGLFAASSES